ncbi:MAG: permease prefix domain 1-containing protein, partial [Oscillospiraceae bacterium]
MRYIEQWCDAAVSYIRFPPDRPAVRQELLEHMQDKYDGYVEEGMSLSDAERRVIREMGSDRETGLLLRKVHKPYLGWVWRVTQWLLVIALILAVYNGIRWANNLYISDGPPLLGNRDVYETTTYEHEHGSGERVLYLEPNCSDSSDGYTFTVTKVAYWEGTYTDESGTRDTNSFYFLLEVTNPRPWAGYTDTPRWFHAVDSLGNYYGSYYEERGSDEPEIRGNGNQTGLFTYTFHMWAERYCSQDADWIELRYDRDGRDIALRIDLTGGEGA